MIYLGIESSCDETAAALIEVVAGIPKILGHRVHSQNHTASGGVIPQVAAREHLLHLPKVMESLFKEAGIQPQDLGGIGVTAGPGLIGGLLVGVMWAKGLALSLSKPLWPVHHLEAHALMVRMEVPVAFPYLLLLLSGGHCMLTLVHDVQRYELLGQTRDDAAGECLDKVARALGGPYPGGVYIEERARHGNPQAVNLPIPFEHAAHCDFSFSGLKTACLQWIQKHPNLTDSEDFCASFQKVIADSLSERVAHALRQTSLLRCVLSGGVAANAYFRQRLQETCAKYGAKLYAPPPAYCTDNGLMIAWTTYELHRKGIAPCTDFQVRPQWPLPH